MTADEFIVLCVNYNLDHRENVMATDTTLFKFSFNDHSQEESKSRVAFVEAKTRASARDRLLDFIVDVKEVARATPLELGRALKDTLTGASEDLKPIVLIGEKDEDVQPSINQIEQTVEQDSALAQIERERDQRNLTQNDATTHDEEMPKMMNDSVIDGSYSEEFDGQRSESSKGMVFEGY